MKVNDVDVLHKQFHPHADAYVIIGKVKNKKTLKKYVVGWVSRHADTRILKPHYFPDDNSAIEHFIESAEYEDIPNRKKITKDWQQDDVYDWLSHDLDQYEKKMTKKDMVALIKKVSKDYGIKAPTLRWIKKQNYSYYEDDMHRISMGHRENLTLLHEMAHAIHSLIIGEGLGFVPHHSPAFTWINIELYNRYADIPLNHLIATAKQRNILGDLDEKQTAVRMPKKGGPKPS